MQKRTSHVSRIQPIQISLPSDTKSRLGSIGIAGFGYDFSSLSGRCSPIIDIFASFSAAKTNPFSHLVLPLSPLPMLAKLSTSWNKILKCSCATMDEISDSTVNQSPWASGL
ncbi:hypothetical protein BD779DRAFT_1235700 [Infundibulicybe gibba]|nr:hypothetical protein BD779DRAFT_1235700 [Infundibulicybe gibba]